MSLSLLVSLLPYWIHANIGIYPVLDDIYFWTISRLFFNFSLTYFPIGHFRESTSETSGLVSFHLGMHPIRLNLMLFWDGSWKNVDLLPCLVSESLLTLLFSSWGRASPFISQWDLLLPASPLHCLPWFRVLYILSSECPWHPAISRPSFQSHGWITSPHI